MILTVTLNSGIDQVLLIDQLVLGSPVLARKQVTCVGGKGLDVSVALSGLGVSNRAISFMAGDAGARLAEIVSGYGIEQEIIWVEGETRTSYVIAEADYQRVSHVKVGVLYVKADHLARLLQVFRDNLPETSWAILAGSIPEGMPTSIYSELTEIARGQGVQTLIDCSGLLALESIRNQPSILKMNWDEFRSTFKPPCQDVSELLASASQIRREHSIPILIVTCGMAGMIAASQTNDYMVRVPLQPAVNAAGAGDAASGALAWRLSLGENLPEALRWAGAVSAAAVLSEATGEVRLEEVERILPEVIVEVF